MLFILMLLLLYICRPTYNVQQSRKDQNKNNNNNRRYLRFDSLTKQQELA